MNPEEFKASIEHAEPPAGLSAPLAALWWDSKGDWARSHALVGELETPTVWLFTLTCIAKREILPMRITGMNVLVADFIGLQSMLSGRHWLMAYSPAQLTRDSYGWCGEAATPAKI